MAVHGLIQSNDHNQNGMTLADMRACLVVAERLDEVIIFRSTGPWAKRWIERGYPTKNFHVKGKSSDWGPHAGFVPCDGIWSKVGFSPEKAAAGTSMNDEGLASGFASRVQLRLSLEELHMQNSRPAGGRMAIDEITAVPQSQDLFLTAARSGDQKLVTFRAVKVGGSLYEIFVFPLGMDPNPRKLMFERPLPLDVMASGEVGANRPMTGDYDLMAVCPTLGQYGSQAPYDISKPAIALARPNPAHMPQPIHFFAGQGMDNVLAPQLHTMSAVNRPTSVRSEQTAQTLKANQRHEHVDMGNLTPRILRCINELNATMGAGAAYRRVHHNAESHRNAAFGALTRRDMQTVKDGEAYGDGLPLTVFQPPRARAAAATRSYGDVCTLETYEEFARYAGELAASGYYVPRNWTWGMPQHLV